MSSNKSDETVTLTARQLAVIDALVATGNITAVAEQVGLTRMTIHRYLQQPAFQHELRAVRRRLVEAATGRIQRHVDAAAGVLLSVMANSGTPPATRVTAAKSVIEFALRAVENDDVDARLAALEQAAAAVNG